MNSDRQSHFHSKIKLSNPIPIPLSKNNVLNKYETKVQYELKEKCFNPNKSPPNSWNYRLMNRILDKFPSLSP